VWTNHPYIDQDEGKEREVDVIALKQLPVHIENSTSKVSIHLVCSCKNNSYPLVLLSRNKNEADKNRTPEEYFFPISVREKGREGVAPTFFRESLDKTHFYHRKQNNLKSVLVCGVSRDGDKWKVRNLVNELVLPVIKAYLAEREAYSLDRKRLLDMNIAEFMTHPERENIWLFFPMIVVSGPLYNLDTSSSISRLTKISHGTITRTLKTKYYEGTFLIEVVQKTGLQNFLDGKIETFVKQVKAKAANCL